MGLKVSLDEILGAASEHTKHCVLLHKYIKKLNMHFYRGLMVNFGEIQVSNVHKILVDDNRCNYNYKHLLIMSCHLQTEFGGSVESGKRNYVRK